MEKIRDENTISASDSDLWSQSALTTQTVGHKLDADDYYAEDLEGVTESLVGSGNLNYLLLQAQQSYESQALQEASAASHDESGLLKNAFAVGGNAAFSADGVTAFASGSFTRSLLDDGAAAQQGGVANNGAGSTTMSLASLGGSAAESAAEVASSSLNTSLNNYFAPPNESPDPTDGGPPDPNPDPTPDPFLETDTDLDLGDTVDDVLTPVGDIVDSVLDDVGIILTGGVDDLPNNVLETTTNVVDGAQDLIDATQGIVPDVVDAGTYIAENVSITDPLSNLGNVQEALSDLLGTHTLGLDVAIRDILEVNTGITFGDDLLPDVQLTISPEVLGIAPISLSTNDILDQTGVTDIVENVDTVLQDTLQNTPLVGDVLSGTEQALGDITQGVGTQLDALASGADALIDTAQETVNDVVEAVMDPLGHVADTTGTLLSPVQDLIEEIVEPVGDLVQDAVGDTVASLLDNLGLISDGNETDTDLSIDLGLEAGDLDLGLAENILLDPVENIIGDVDIGLLAGADADGISDLDLTVDGDLFDQVGNLLGLGDTPYVGDGDGGTEGNEGGGLLGTPEPEAIISALGDMVDDTLGDTVDTSLDLLNEAIAGTEEALGDLLPGDGPLLDDLLSHGSILDVLPDPGGSASEGLAGLFGHHDDGGGFAGLF